MTWNLTIYMGQAEAQVRLNNSSVFVGQPMAAVAAMKTILDQTLPGMVIRDPQGYVQTLGLPKPAPPYVPASTKAQPIDLDVLFGDL